MQQTDIEVRLHYKCNSHALIYRGWTWKCTNGDVFQPSVGGFSGGTLSYSVDDNRIYYAEVDYDKLDLEDEVVSKNATRSIFTWLRSKGYLASEKGISLHEWLKHYESDDNRELEDLESISTGKNNQLNTKVAAWFDQSRS